MTSFIFIHLNNINIRKKNVFERLLKYKLHRVTSKLYVNPFGVHLLCSRPDVVYTSVHVQKIMFIS